MDRVAHFMESTSHDNEATTAATEPVPTPPAGAPTESALAPTAMEPTTIVGRRIDPPHRPAAVMPAIAEASDEPAPLGLRRGDRLVLVVVTTLGLILAGMHWARLSGWGLKPIEIDRPAEQQFEYRLDANTATWVEWMQLPGIGETLARRIIDDRDTNGPFRTVEDISRVKGIGPKTLEKLRPWLTVTPMDDEGMRR
jgi:competence protein ComEA